MKTKITMVFLLVCGWCSFAQTVGQTFASGGINYRITSVTTVDVTANNGISGDIIIPSSVEYEGKTFSIAKIESIAFVYSNDLISVSLPNTISSIGTLAFAHCYNLSKVILNDGLISIGGSAFYDCDRLTSIVIPKSVESIGVSSFGNCNGLEDVRVSWFIPLKILNNVFHQTNIAQIRLSVPAGRATVYSSYDVWRDFDIQGLTPAINDRFVYNGIKYVVTKSSLPYEVAVDENAPFSGPANIPAVAMNRSVAFNVTSIASNAFASTALTSIVIPSSITTIGIEAFILTELVSINIPDSVTSIGDNAFAFNLWLTSAILPINLTTIGTGLFSNCSRLTSINIPNSVASIGDKAFENCTGLSSVTVNWSMPLSISSTVFERVGIGSIRLNVPAGTASLYNNTAIWTDFLINPYEVSYCVGATAQALQSPYAAPSGTLWYTSSTGGSGFAVPPVVNTSRAVVTSFWVAEVVNNVQRTRELVRVLVNALPATPGAISGIAAQGNLVGNTTLATYSVSPVAGVVSYIWTLPAGINMVSGHNTSNIVVNFAGVATGAGAIGNLSVVTVNRNGCASLPRTLALTKALLAAPTRLVMTDPSLPISVTGIPTPITNFSRYAGENDLLTLTVSPVVGATSYSWSLPTGVTAQPAATITTSNVIRVRFRGVNNTNAQPIMINGVIVSYSLTIGVQAVNGVGASTARQLTLSGGVPNAPTLSMINLLSSLPTPVTNISSAIGTSTVFRITATPIAGATSYLWELPAGVTQLSGNNTNQITVNFATVASGSSSLYIGVKGINGLGSSSLNNSAALPATSSTARLLRLTYSLPSAPSLSGQFSGLCGGSSYTYTIIPSATATSYQVTAPVGAAIAPSSLNTATLSGSNLTFIVTYPLGFSASGAPPQNINLTAVNGVGSGGSTNFRLSTSMPVIGTVTGSRGITIFRKTGTQTFTIPAVLGATSYTWAVANGATIVTGQGTSTVEVDFAGVTQTSTRITVLATNACGISTAVKGINLTFSPLKNATVNAIVITSTEVYPNPVISNLNIDITASAAGSLEMAIYSLKGNLVLKPKTTAVSQGTTTISENVSVLPKGIYILQLLNTSNNEVITKKLIKN